MTVDQAIRQRRSVRGFLPDEVPEATLREVFELAQLAPSNCNVQPWVPHVVSGEALRRLTAALVEAGTRDRPEPIPTSRRTGNFSGFIANARSMLRSSSMARWASNGETSSAARWLSCATTPASTRRMRSSSSCPAILTFAKPHRHVCADADAGASLGIASCAQGALRLPRHRARTRWRAGAIRSSCSEFRLDMRIRA